MTFLHKLAATAALGLMLGIGSASAQQPSPENTLTLTTDKGDVVIALRPDLAPQHVARIKDLASKGEYNDVVFHRVIEGFMAQTGDVQYGKRNGSTEMAGMGGSSQADLPAEFSKETFDRGTVGMARSQDPNSANSQFFIMLADGDFLDGQYTVVGDVVTGMDVVDQIKKGDPNQNGAVADPDYIVSAKVGG
ncbi:peptidylprolyl isomerase [Antarcticirhabdus aurantiaca]|uniref:Peptidylprolyl isomerase n=1 Tax=Antarcticirhabdus aurantiaca TaxID=2606717 RepID=A0ACD4NW26_9HYPH|nr:peptidylprolyl isomerase [Antarcticirhabdus aurantiaca]WAJ30988.1 peptidylprolyl isomerase [Jeongeuplla avenae]